MAMKWLVVFFFFSSRRRHTISLCDWSSDVCSSDLVHRVDDELGAEHHTLVVDSMDVERLLPRTVYHLDEPRSEERRVGKECNYRRLTVHSTEHYLKYCLHAHVYVSRT